MLWLLIAVQLGVKPPLPRNDANAVLCVVDPYADHDLPHKLVSPLRVRTKLSVLAPCPPRTVLGLSGTALTMSKSLLPCRELTEPIRSNGFDLIVSLSDHLL